MCKQAQVDQDKKQENAKKIKYDYAVGDQAYVRIQGIKRKVDNTKRVNTQSHKCLQMAQ